MSDGNDKSDYVIPVAVDYKLVEKPVEAASSASAESQSPTLNERNTAPAKVNFAPANIKVAPILDIPKDEELPDLENLSPEQEKALDEKVS